jgi:MFS family permease
VVFFVLSPVVGGLVARIGVRRLLTCGIVAIAAGLFWLSLLGPGDGYATHVLPGSVLWGLGLGLAVTPLTAGVLAAVSDDELGEASAINDAAARIGGLVMIALVPALIGVGDDDLRQALATGYQPAMLVAGALSLGAAIISGLFVSDQRPSHVLPAAPLPQVHSCPLPVPEPARTSGAGS